MSLQKSPSVIVLVEPKGAGKSTVAPILLKGKLGVREFVNSDTFAEGLSAFARDARRWRLEGSGWGGARNSPTSVCA